MLAPYNYKNNEWEYKRFNFEVTGLIKQPASASIVHVIWVLSPLHCYIYWAYAASEWRVVSRTRTWTVMLHKFFMASWWLNQCLLS